MSDILSETDRMDVSVRPPYEVDMQSSGSPAEILAYGVLAAITIISMGVSFYLSKREGNDTNVDYV